ncbi:N-acylneuraminate cytidylyltransferase [Gramella sp. Hel_I_59]|uniref:acylneuraminate cytidylyltransferase family protein n=1 Tax=Gramella sp. Hel_I_59 TaxID=1249978 RepID=UPI00114E8DD9|nr:acylneuraminate cytidylyltransferase family protein [Gramella sp. Hel_I_59]TQI70411.1 N-acylneuraminate cytidylyltransferase [Gramella sp. Hel_I_59]
MRNNRKIIAIIPARGGSKRIPKKNIIDFLGKPLIAWTIEAAKKSHLFDKIVVSTDSKEIAEVSREYGAEVPFLRDAAADDHSPVSDATLRTVLQLEEQGEFYDDVVQLFAVCPLRTSDDIINSYQDFLSRDVPFSLSCYKFIWMNPWWAVTLDDNNKPDWIFEGEMKRSQDLPELYSPTGAIWIGKVDKLKQEKTFYGDGHIFWEMDWKNAVDIDNYEDLELAKAFKNIIIS